MKLPSENQWARYSALCAQLRPLPTVEREAALQAFRAQGTDDPQVLSLVALHWALPPDPDRLRTGERVGHCILEEPLGAGGMGVVYRAQQHLGPARRPVAVKLIHPALLRTAGEEASARFLTELHILVTLQHEHIARIYDGGIYEDPSTHEQLPYLVMELVRGGLPLTTYATDHTLTWPERLTLMVRVCRAVEYAHEHRVVHRDLKPPNILVDSEGRPVIIDFGLAQACDVVLPGAHLAVSGTPAYMSPEQVSDALGPISAKSDVYALGLILYELLTAKHPYAPLCDSTFVQWCQVITEAPLPLLSHQSEMDGGELEEIIAVALAKRPADRFRVDVLRARLERYLKKLPPDRDWPLHETKNLQPDTQTVTRHDSRCIVPAESHQWVEVDARLPTAPTASIPVERHGPDQADAGPPHPIQAGDPQDLGREGRVSPLPFSPSPPLEVFGRQAELAHLYRCLTQTCDGQRQVVFVTGEPGIGKTTLVDAFFKGLPDQSNLWIGRGQCIAQYGVGEAYLPLLEALGRLGREGGNDILITILDRHAPTWLAQMPALIAPRALPTLLQRVQGATQQRMLREIADGLEVLTAERPLLLWLEDLQWSDVSTLQLLTWLAMRQGPARLFILGTFRPVEVGCPLDTMVQELHIKGACQEIALPPLSEEAVAAYLAQRWVDADPMTLPQLVSALYRRTEGHPLFLGHVVNYLDAQGWRESNRERGAKDTLEKLLREVPRDIYRMVETQITCRSLDEQRVLEAASVAGAEFSTAAVAAGGDIAFERVEELCADLARRGHFLQTRGMIQWPDMTLGTAYRFVHALYQEVLYSRMLVLRRISLHQRIGSRYEEAYKGHTEGVASELAVHFTQGRQFRQAIYYRQQAAEGAMQRSAYQEAIVHLTHGLDILQELPNGTERLQQELMLRTALGPALMATKGYAAAEVQAAYLQAQELCRQVPESPQLFPTLFGLWGFYLMRAEYAGAHALAQQLLNVAQGVQESGLLVEAHGALGVTAFYMGHFVISQAHLAQGLAYYDPVQHRGHALRYGQDPWVACRSWEGLVLWVLGYPEQALERCQEAFAYAQELAYPFSMVFALYNLALVHQLRRESAVCQERATMQLHLSEEQGFPFWAGPGLSLLGWALAEQGHTEEGCQRLCEGLAMRQAMGAAQPRPYFAALLAQIYGRAGKVREALELLSVALKGAADLGEQWCEAELARVQGELMLQAIGEEQCTHGRAQTVETVRSTEQEAEACFQKALTLAQHQGAKAWELRATLSLSRLWARQGKQAEARQILEKMQSTLPQGGRQTIDLQEARTLLTQWA